MCLNYKVISFKSVKFARNTLRKCFSLTIEEISSLDLCVLTDLCEENLSAAKTCFLDGSVPHK